MSKPAPSGTRSRSSPSAMGPTLPCPSHSHGSCAASDAAKPVDIRKMLLPQLGIPHAKALFRRKTQHADLALVLVVVHLVSRLTGVLERVHTGQCRMDLSLGNQPVGLPRLAVVGEVRADDPLQVNPQIAVVVLVQPAARGRARDERATLPGEATT